MSKQPGLLRRDTEATLRPRLRYLALELGEPALATRTVRANPRLLLSSWGVLGRLSFVREKVRARRRREAGRLVGVWELSAIEGHPALLHLL